VWRDRSVPFSHLSDCKRGSAPTRLGLCATQLFDRCRRAQEAQAYNALCIEAQRTIGRKLADELTCLCLHAQ
jgi:hypothetical protein